MHLEDDIRVPWAGLLSYLEDAPVIASFGFQRGFIRTEISRTTGKLNLPDQRGRINLNTYNRILHVQEDGLSSHHFIQLPNPYQAFWVADQALLDSFMATQVRDILLGNWLAWLRSDIFQLSSFLCFHCSFGHNTILKQIPGKHERWLHLAYNFCGFPRGFTMPR